MSYDNDTTPTDEVSDLLDKMHEEIMIKRFEYMALRKRKSETVNAALEELENLEFDFNSLIKIHTNYMKFKKASGQESPKASDNLLQKINEIKSNMGLIIAVMPKN